MGIVEMVKENLKGNTGVILSGKHPYNRVIECVLIKFLEQLWCILALNLLPDLWFSLWKASKKSSHVLAGKTFM